MPLPTSKRIRPTPYSLAPYSLLPTPYFLLPRSYRTYSPSPQFEESTTNEHNPSLK